VAVPGSQQGAETVPQSKGTFRIPLQRRLSGWPPDRASHPYPGARPSFVIPRMFDGVIGNQMAASHNPLAVTKDSMIPAYSRKVA